MPLHNLQIINIARLTINCGVLFLLHLHFLALQILRDKSYELRFLIILPILYFQTFHIATLHYFLKNKRVVLL